MKKYLIVLVIFLLPINIFALEKTETVYATLDSNGQVKKTSINTKLTDLDKGDITDFTKLKDIKNINGEELFSYESGKITWKSTGKDILYKGVLNDSLPIEVQVKYYLNNEEIDVSKLNNRKGNIKIEYIFKNNSYDYNSGLYTPFVVSGITTISKDCTNINITNGKVINNGNINMAIALASPGLSKNFNISELNTLDKITITYKTNKFKVSDVYFVITPKLLSEIDVARLDDLSSSLSSINTLQDGMNKLEKGSNQLLDGVSELTTGVDALSNGINEALNGSTKLTNGLKQVNDGTSNLESMTLLVDSLYSNYVNNKELINAISSGYAKSEYEEGITRGNATKTELEKKLSQVNAGISQLEMLAELNEEQTTQLRNLQNNKTQLEAGINECSAAITKAEQDLLNLPSNEAKLMGANEVITQVLMGLLGVENESEITEEAINSFKTKILDLVAGINQLTNGSSELTNGLLELYTGSKKL